MAVANKERIYNLKVVIRETGIKPDTLRAWERRYGLPQPERTMGGHRLYSDYDIDIIKWLIARQNEGMRINRAVELWKRLESEGRLPPEVFPKTDAIGESRSSLLISGENLDAMREAWKSACLAFDERSAENILAQSFARYPLEPVCLEVLRRGLSEIGGLWYSGRATVQQEHFASSLALRRLDTLIAASSPPTRSETILVACSPQEEHVFPPMLIALFLRYKGWNVVYLGADVPLVNLDKAVVSTKADLIILNAAMLNTAVNLYDVSTYLRSRNKVVAYGGNIFNRLPALRNRIPGLFLGERLDNVTRSVEEYLVSQPLPPETEPTSSEYLSAASMMLDNQYQVDAYVWEAVKSNGISQNSLQIANEYLGKNIVAALKLGNIKFLEPDIEWVAELIKNHGLPSGTLPKYLKSYAEAVVKYLPRYEPLIADYLYARSNELVPEQE